VPPGECGVLAGRILRVMTEPGLAARLGGAARVEAASRYSFDRMVAAFDDLYVTQLIRRGVIAAGTLRLAAS
jgi:hypothetical protein